MLTAYEAFSDKSLIRLKNIELRNAATRSRRGDARCVGSEGTSAVMIDDCTTKDKADMRIQSLARPVRHLETLGVFGG